MRDLKRALVAEALGALILSGAVIGSGILASRLSPDSDAVALLGNSGATAAILFMLITALAPVSGAHFNPAVTLVMALRRRIKPTDAVLYVIVQIAGCACGALLAHAMFGLPLVQEAETVRSGLGLTISEAMATFALIAAIILVSNAHPNNLAAAVSLTIAAGYWWTASTSFANPAITIARAMSDTFAGIRPADVPAFILAQIVGALLASALCTYMLRTPQQ